jgi:hypothetical protein
MGPVTGPEAPFQPVPTGPPLAAGQNRTSGRVVAGFVCALLPPLWLLAMMLACDAQEDLERDPLLGPRGLNIATFCIVGIGTILAIVGFAALALIG